MKDFTRKLEQMDTLFICKFSVSDYVNHQFKIYFISPDSDHQYMVVNQIQNNEHNHECFIGNLFLDSKSNVVLFKLTEILEGKVNKIKKNKIT